MKRWGWATAAGVLALGVSGASAAIKTETISYKHGGAVLRGFLAYDDAVQEKRPGVLVFPEWWGLNDFTKEKAKELAQMGYVAFAVDMYGNGQNTTDPNEARKLATFYKSDRTMMRGRAQAALKALRKQKSVDPSRIAAIGFCFGGTSALELARSGADIRGVVSFHGGLSSPTPGDAKNIKAKVLVLHGADDPNEPPKEIADFMDEMRQGHVDWQMMFYGDTVHAFTNPAAGNDKSRGAAYNERSARRAWRAMKDFFDNDVFPRGA